jgi:hypothetical protein
MLTVENVNTPGTTERRPMLKIAVAYMRWLRERRDTYERECAEYARQGYRPHYCIHGTNQWTDYDNICGPCEEGYIDQELALQWAHNEMRQWIERMTIVNTFHRDAQAKGARVPAELALAMGEWTAEPLETLTRHPRPVRNLP